MAYPTLNTLVVRDDDLYTVAVTTSAELYTESDDDGELTGTLTDASAEVSISDTSDLSTLYDRADGASKFTIIATDSGGAIIMGYLGTNAFSTPANVYEVYQTEAGTTQTWNKPTGTFSFANTPITYEVARIAPLGQLQNIQLEETYEDRQYKRVSTGNVRVAGDRATNVTLSLYADDDLEEVARILGTAKPVGGWAAETVTLDPDQVLQILVTGFDGTGSTAAANQVWTVPNFSPRSLTTGLSPDNPTLVQVRGISDALVLDPNPQAYA